MEEPMAQIETKRPQTVERHVERKPEPKQPRQTDAQKSKALHGALTEMVRQAEASGQRDLPHVARAREILEADKPEQP